MGALAPRATAPVPPAHLLRSETSRKSSTCRGNATAAHTAGLRCPQLHNPIRSQGRTPRTSRVSRTAFVWAPCKSGSAQASARAQAGRHRRPDRTLQPPWGARPCVACVAALHGPAQPSSLLRHWSQQEAPGLRAAPEAWLRYGGGGSRGDSRLEHELAARFPSRRLAKGGGLSAAGTQAGLGTSR